LSATRRFEPIKTCPGVLLLKTVEGILQIFFHMRKITIIEDDDDLRKLIQRNLEVEGFAVEALPDGHRILSSNGVPYAYSDLYLIDIDLNGTSGLDICRFIKSKAETRMIPVVMVSANAELKSLSKAACADDILAKPFDKNSLLTKIKNLLRQMT
jgi:two-component system, OmpR family, phosphate regulon response regulator PhoB